MIRGALLSLALAPAALADQPVPGAVPQALSETEIQAFRASVGKCWNAASLTGAARAVSVTLAFEIGPDRRPRPETIRLVGAPDAAAADLALAFEAARRAVLRCGSAGFDLPDTKYAHWADVEITFDGAGLR